MNLGARLQTSSQDVRLYVLQCFVCLNQLQLFGFVLRIA